MDEPSRSGRPRDPDVDARIVAATKALLIEGGLDAVTIAAVAARAGVGRPTVYRRYPDREALALAVLFQDLEDRVVAHVPEVPRELPLLDQLVALVRPLFAYYSEQPAVSSALLQLAMFSDAPGRGDLDAQLFAFLGEVGARVEAARARGELAPDADARTLGFAFFALYFMTAIGGIKGMMPEVDVQVETFRAMMAQQLRGAGGR